MHTNISEEFSLPRTTDSQCTCLDCDSLTCFSKRHKKHACTCEDCNNIETCILHDINTPSGSLDAQDVIDLARKLDMRESAFKKLIKDEVLYVCDKDRRVKNTEKPLVRDSTETDLLDEIMDKKMEEKTVKIHDANVTPQMYSRRNLRSVTSTQKLAAQIMDVNLNDLKDSVSYHKPTLFQHVPKLSPYDIFKRIREVYKACSCKVCECIIGKSLKNDNCSCEPCNCSDCTNISPKNIPHKFGNLFPTDDEGCPCVNCNRNSCKGISGNKAQPQVCDCVPRTREEKKDDCHCKPCECPECKAFSSKRRMLVVAPVGQNRHTMCQCSPCDCAECGYGYRVTEQQNEMSTGINRHQHCQCESCIAESCIPDGNESCWCTRHSKVMNKPFQSNNRDYDIHRTSVSHSNRKRNRKIHDTITMYAHINNPFNKMAEKKLCDCDACVCISCQHKDQTMSKCICSPCECQVCDARREVEETRAMTTRKICYCTTCDCLNCEAEKLSKDNPFVNLFPNSTCTRNLYENFSENENFCVNQLEKDLGNDFNHQELSGVSSNTLVSDGNLYPLKKSEILTPSVYESKMKKSLILCNNSHTENEGTNSISNRMCFKTKFQEQRDDYLNEPPHCSFQRNPQQQSCYHNSIKPAEVEERTQQNMNIGSFDELRCFDDTNPKALEKSRSLNSSMSNFKDSGSISPESRCKKISLESSGSSSRHDYSNYVNYAKTTVETCLNDVMNRNTVDSINLNTVTLRPKCKSGIKPTNTTPNIIYDNNSLSNPLQTRVNKIKKDNLNTTFDDCRRSTDFDSKYSKWYRSKYASDDVMCERTQDTKDNCSINLTHNMNTPQLEVTNIIDDDYQKAQETLQSARDFSKQLVQLLQKYEHANKEFDGVTQNLANSDSAYKNVDNRLSDTKADAEYVSGSECNDTQNDAVSLDSSSGIDEIPIKEEKIIKDIADNVLLEADTDNIEELYCKLKDGFEIKDDIDVNKIFDIRKTNIFDIKEVYLAKRNFNANDSTKGKSIKDILNTIAEEKESVDIKIPKASKVNAEKKYDRKRIRTYNKMYKRTIKMCKKLKVNPKFTISNIDASLVTKVSKVSSHSIEEKTENIYVTKQDNIPRDILSKYDEIKANGTTTADSNKNPTSDAVQIHGLRDDDEDDANIVTIKPPRLEVLKKNVYLGCDPNTRKGNALSSFSRLEFEMKEAMRAVSYEATTIQSNAFFRPENQALAKLHSEVKKLLQLPMLTSCKMENNCNHETKCHHAEMNFNRTLRTHLSPQTREFKQHRDEFNYDLNKLSGSNSNMDTLKVNYLSVRKVSDHTALVKWIVPQNLALVEGYELLVDGRPVQKILSPSKCMAVVTCLPHAERILLTVRTVTHKSCLIDYTPAATVVYRPRRY